MGRCILGLQQYEIGLKHFLSTSVIEGGDPETFKSNLDKRKTHYSSRTLGQLIGDFTGQHVSIELRNESESATDAPPLPDSSQPYFRTKFSLIEKPEEYQTLIGNLASLVYTRNELVHHFLQRFHLNDQDSCQQAIDYLKTVRKMIRAYTKQLLSWDKGRIDTMSKMSKFFTSPMFEAWLMFGFFPGDNIDWPNAVVVAQLKRAESVRSKDGWTELTLAIADIKTTNPSLTPKAHGCANWRDLLRTSGLFDIRRERGEGSAAVTFFRSRQIQ